MRRFYIMTTEKTAKLAIRKSGGCFFSIPDLLHRAHMYMAPNTKFKVVDDNEQVVLSAIFISPPRNYHSFMKRSMNLTKLMLEGRLTPMPDGYLDGRPVYFGDTELDGVDSYFLNATWADTDVSLSDDELNDLTDRYTEYLQEKSAEHYGYWED